MAIRTTATSAMQMLLRVSLLCNLIVIANPLIGNRRNNREVVQQYLKVCYDASR
jgi:hypothetical protein